MTVTVKMHRPFSGTWPRGDLTEEGEVVGLIGAFGREDGSKGRTPRLIQVPAVPGSYLHLRQLTAAELELATKRSRQQSDA
ncbi:hypothetical protein CJU94_37700 (plasmid) [Paraburkholderia aromaticivorans]|uniref:Uncharacterized protein n=1 Tax=Paraburkholderia aromaticivorans TaxID=2026199 RepID=A0A248VXY3_9BURK|nr:hypothetical protein CJU94_37700 [Paraburkholderia aromaticivorans]